MLAAEALTKRYGDHAAVDGLTFEIPAGHVLGLIGPNGAGKTTAMKMLLGLVRPSAGRGHLLGAEIGSPEFVHAVQRVGALIESPGLYERLSARQNLELQARALGISDSPTRIGELLELVDLVDRADDHPRTYSLGMKQRLGIAVALMGRPALVMLDEPANGLDPAGIVEIRSLLRRLPEMGTTVLVSSHQLAEVEQACDSLIVLANGRLISQGTTTQIVDREEDRTFQVDVEPSDLDDAVRTVRANNLSVDRLGPGAISLELPTTWTGRDLNIALTNAGVYAHQITKQSQSLEDAFLALTSDPGVDAPPVPAPETHPATGVPEHA